MSIELKPCPFCGEPPMQHGGFPFICIHCGNDECLMKPTVVGSQSVDAFTSWNTRAPIVPVSVSLEKCAQAIFESRYPFSWDVCSKRVLNENLYAEASQCRIDAKALLEVIGVKYE